MQVSILLIVYNHEKYISLAIGSILSQKNFDEIDIVVLDDNSTDNSSNIILSEFSGFRNVRYVKNKVNLGHVRNYQQAFSLCYGDLIFILEGDDYWINPNKIHIISSIMSEDLNASMCFHDYYVLNHKQTISERFIYTDISQNNFISTEYLLKDSTIIGNYSVCCYRKEFINKIPDSFWKNNTNDWGLNMLMGTFGHIRYCSQKMSVYRLHNESLWTGETTIKKYKYILGIIPYYKSIIGVEYVNSFDELEIKIWALIRELKESTRPYKKIKNYIRKIIS